MLCNIVCVFDSNGLGGISLYDDINFVVYVYKSCLVP